MWPDAQRAPQGLDDLVNYAALIAPGVVLGKDGSLLTAWHFRGPDLDYASPEEIERLSTQISAAFTRCSDGWMLHLDLVRLPVTDYLLPGVFPDPTTALIDEERRRAFHRAGQHFRTVAALTLTYCPPPDREQRWTVLLYTGARATQARATLVLDGFRHTVTEVEDILGSVLHLARMSDDELLTYLHYCVTGIDRQVPVPSVPVDLDSVIADQDLVGGFTPMIGEQYARVISLDGYPRMTEPGAQAFLHELPMPCRWSTRFVFLDRREAERLLYTTRKHWWQKRSTFIHKLADAGSGGNTLPMPQEDALEMAADANTAAAEAASGEVIFGLYTMTLIVMDEDEGRVDERAREVQKQVQRHGFGARLERPNALEALIGSWPGHGYQNVRRVPMHSMNLADLLPLTTVWTGEAMNPNPYFPPASPALMLTATAGQTPFFLNLHVSDLGHTIVVGPTASGKSTLLGMLAAQWRRYPDAQVFWFDKGYSSFVLCQAAEGQHYDIGGDDTPVAFCPLAQVDNELEREWALGWLEELLRLQGLTITPAQRTSLWRALTLLGSSSGSRTMTDLVATLQEHELREGFRHYTLGGGAGSLLDASDDSLRDSAFMVFEMEALLNRGDKDLVPVLLYLFHRVEQRLQEGQPTLIPVDEAWLMLAHTRFAEQLEEWLRTLRKKNAAVVFVTQSLADLERSPQRHLLIESCPTKIFLPNAEARTTQSAQLYEDLGLNDQQIEVVSYALPKKHYLYTSPLGRRLFDLHLGPAALSFVGAGGRDDLRRVRTLIHEHGDGWPAVWLTERGCSEEARWWRRWRTTHAGNGHERQEDSYDHLFADMGTHRDDAHHLEPAEPE
jgi:type IV secretion system protein VirB4